MSNKVRATIMQKENLYWVDLVCGCIVSYFIGYTIKKIHKR